MSPDCHPTRTIMRHLLTTLLQLAAALIVFSRQAFAVALPTLPLVIGTRHVCAGAKGLKDPVFMEKTSVEDNSKGYKHLVFLKDVVSDIMDRLSGDRVDQQRVVDDLDQGDKNVMYFLPDIEYTPRSIMMQTYKLQSECDRHKMNTTVVPILYTGAETNQLAMGKDKKIRESEKGLGRGLKKIVGKLHKVRTQNLLVHGNGAALLPAIQKQNPAKFANVFMFAPTNISANAFSVEKNKDKESRMFSGRKLSSLGKRVHLFYDPDDRILKKRCAKGKTLLGLTGMTGIPDAKCDNVLQVDCSDHARFSDPYQHHYFYNSPFAIEYMKNELDLNLNK